MNEQAFATLFAATIGFTGVIVTLVWNGRRNRAADREKAELDREVELRKLSHEQRVLRVALRAELQNLVNTITDEIEYISTHAFNQLTRKCVRCELEVRVSAQYVGEC